MPTDINLNNVAPIEGAQPLDEWTPIETNTKNKLLLDALAKPNTALARIVPMRSIEEMRQNIAANVGLLLMVPKQFNHFKHVTWEGTLDTGLILKGYRDAREIVDLEDTLTIRSYSEYKSVTFHRRVFGAGGVDFISKTVEIPFLKVDATTFILPATDFWSWPRKSLDDLTPRPRRGVTKGEYKEPEKPTLDTVLRQTNPDDVLPIVERFINDGIKNRTLAGVFMKGQFVLRSVVK